MERSLIVFFIILGLSFQTIFPSIGNTDDNSITLNDFKKEIQAALFFAQKQANSPPFFLVKKIDLSIGVTDEKSGEAGIKIPVLPIGGKVSGEFANKSFEKIAVTMKPVTKIAVSGDLKVSFVEALKSVKKAFKEEKENTGFIVTNFEYRTKFQIRKKMGAMLEIFIIDASAEGLKEYTHTIVISMCETKNKLNCASDE